MGCTVREKHVRANRKTRPATKSKGIVPCCLIDKAALSRSIVESSLKNLVYHPGLTDTYPGPCSKPSGNSEECVWGYCTEDHLEEILLKYLEFIYYQCILKLVELGYEESVALRAVLSYGQCYGELDVLNNIVNNSLSYLNSRSCGGGSNKGGKSEDQSETSFSDLKELEEYSLAGMIYLLQQVKPNLSKGDAMWCLLMSELNVNKASIMDIPTSRNRAKEVDKRIKEHSPVVPALCRFHGGWDFGNCGGGGGVEFSGNGFSVNDGELKLQREIDFPKRFNLSPSMKSLLKRNVAAFAAGFRASMKQKQVETEESGDTDTVPEESMSSMLEKFDELNIDGDNQDGVIVTLLHQVKDLEKKVKERKEWAQKKAMQAAQKVSDELNELKCLNSERDVIQMVKKGNHTVEESTIKRLSDLENAIRKASSEMDRANASVRKLESQNAEIRAEREGSKLSASESLKACMEESKKERKTMKKLVAWEKQKLKLQDEINAEKEKIKSLYKSLAQITKDEKEYEVKWRQEQKAKEQAMAKVEEEQNLKEAAEAENKRKLETLRLKTELDFQRHKDDHQRLEQEVSRLKTDSSHLPNNVWKTDKSKGDNIAKMLEELDKLEGSDENEAIHDRECIICMKEEVSVVFLPCAHQVVCVSCSDDFFTSNGGSKVTCPCCRAVVQQRIRIFGATS